MLIRVRKKHLIRPSEITPEAVFLDRRELIRRGRDAAILSNLGLWSIGNSAWAKDEKMPLLPGVKPNSKYQDARLKKLITDYDDVTSYNNFYEFGTDKDDPKKNAKNFKTKPWTLKVDGLVEKPADYNLEDFLKPFELEDRIYRFRCVEAWSMVVPWVGIPLKKVIEKVKPKSDAKFVKFQTLFDPAQMPGQKSSVLDWPYQEGLRLDEAMHDLTLLVVGAYGRVLPNQNGAPLRLIVPWKYGYKSIKSIVRLEFTNSQPKTSWEIRAPDEYPFYSNVNPDVPHPRWSQKTERVIGSGLFAKRQDTLPFNGYDEEVASLYRGFDQKKLY